MGKGSNDLNLLLKAKVVEIKVKLDYKNSGLTKQVNDISKFLENKHVKIKVKLSATVADLNKQMSDISKTISNSKSFKPMKIAVQIDVKGSADNIKKQLKEVHDTVSDFNKKYGEQLKQINKMTVNPPKVGKQTSPTIDTKLYADSVKDAQKYMKKSFGKGLFSSAEMKNAEGELLGFVGTLTKANGVVEKIRYQWDSKKNTFSPISQQTVTQTEKVVKQTKKALQNMYSDIEKLKNGAGKTALFSQHSGLEQRSNKGTLTMDDINILQRMTKEEGVLQQQVKSANSEFLTQRKLLHEIKKAKDADWKATGDIERRKQFNNLSRDVKQNPSNLKEQAFELRQINDLKTKQVLTEKEILANTKSRMKVARELRAIEGKTVSTDRTSQRLIGEIKLMNQKAKSAKDYVSIASKMDKLKTSNSNDADLQKSVDLQFKIQQKLERLVQQRKLTNEQFGKAMTQLSVTAGKGVADLERQFSHLNRMVIREDANMKKLADSTKTIFNRGTNKATNLKGIVNSGDIDALQKYFGEMYKGKVETISTKDVVDKFGRSVTEMKVKMQGAGKQVQTYTLQMERANGALRQTGQGLDFNANRNLGVMEQLKVAMARVPVWMVAMTAFYGTVSAVKSMTSEILKLDQALTELRRVASDSLSIDVVFAGAIDLSKELGNNIHDVMKSVGELSRTFGHFNERQLLAITKTATLMSNVSDLTADEATQNLVGTMNAFNISAEKSIHIVDALNEVDNDYAISTKQLSEGLSKSASTAKTFGVTMEETVGHITAIGSVTMESGAIIGNSLKTIYSRITTMKGVDKVLGGIGVSLVDSAGETRKVGDILGDVASRWNKITDAERQNIAVKVAGRYQLSRFLALMNSWETASLATETAMHSEGSAMRENAEYMKSFEARINQLKNSWTEFSNAVGNAILSDGLMLTIGLLGKLASMGVEVVDKIGVLPVLFGILAGAMLKMGVFTKLIAGIIKFTSIYRASMTAMTIATQKATATGTTRTVALSNAWNSVSTSATRATVATRVFGTAVKGALIGTGIGALIVALGIGIEKLVSHMAKEKAKKEELIKLNKKMVDGYRQHRDGMDGMMNRYEELTKKTSLTAEEQKELNGLTSDFAKQLPTTVSYIDANGKAHMKNTAEMRREIEAVKALSKANADLEMTKFTENIEKQTEAYAKIEKKIEDVRKKTNELKAEDGKVVPSGLGYGGKPIMKDRKVDNTKELQETRIEEMMLEAERTERIKKTIKSIQAQTGAYLESKNMMSSVGDEQLKVTEKFVSANEAMLRNSKDYTKTQTQMYDVGNAIGTTFAQAFDTMSATVKNTDLKKDMKLDAFRAELDSVAKSIPESFYALNDASGNVVKSSTDVVEGLKEIVNVSHVMGDASREDTDKFIHRLQRAGFSAEDAQGYLYRLANEHDNLAIKTELSARGIDENTGSLEDLNAVAMDAIDLTATLFGYSGTEIAGLKSHLQAMHLIVDVQGKAGKQTAEYLASQEALTDFLGITSQELDTNKDKYYGIIGALTDLDLASYDSKTSWEKFINDSKLAPDQKKVLLAWDGTKDIITGAVRETAEAIEKEPIKEKLENVFNNLNLKIPEIDVTTIGSGVHYVKQDIGALEKAVADMGIKFGTPTGVAIFDELMTSLELSDGKIKNTEYNMGVFRGILNTGIANPALLESINLALGGTEIKADQLNTKLGIVGQTPPTTIPPVFGMINQEANTVEARLGLLNTGLTNVGQTPPTTTPSFGAGINTEIGTIQTNLGLLDTNYGNTANLFRNPLQINMTPTNNALNATVGLTQTVQTESAKAVSAGSQVSVVNTDMQTVIDKASSVQTKLNELNSTLGKLGDGFGTNGVVSAIGRIGDKLIVVGQLTDGLRNSMNKSIQIGGIGRLIEQLGLLSGTLVLAKRYGQETADSQVAIALAFSRVANTIVDYNVAVGNAGSNVAQTYSAMKSAVAQAVDAMVKAYIRNASEMKVMVRIVEAGLKDMIADFDSASILATGSVDKMSSEMHKEFKSGMDKLVATASGVPARIGKAIRDNMGEASSAMDAVAKDMIKRFKSELGIHSPSRVFTDLGGWVIKGLSNGLTGGNLKELGTQVFRDFGGEAFSTMDSIKDYMQFGAGDVGIGADFAQFSKTSGFGMRKHPITGKMTPHNGQDFAGANNSPIQAKAGGRVTASGASGSSFGNYVKVQNGEYEYIYAHLNKALPAVGSTVKSGQMIGLMGSTGGSTGTHLHYEVRKNGKPVNPRGFEEGGHITHEEIIRVGEGDKQEMIIPLEQHRSRAIDLWSQAGQYLGMNTELIKAFTKRGKGGMASMGGGSFGASDGEGGTSTGGGDSGSSGVMQASVPTLPSSSILIGGTNLFGDYDFNALATAKKNKSGYHYEGNKRVYDDPQIQKEVNNKKKAKATPKKKAVKKIDPRENIADAVSFDILERSANAYTNAISLLEARMTRMNKTSTQYRESVKKLLNYESQLQKTNVKSLKATEARQTAIQKYLKTMPSLSKQTTKEREVYNRLSTEFNDNITKIGTLKVGIENTVTSLRDKSLEIFNVLIDRIVERAEKAITKIKDTLDNIDFKKSVLELTDPENTKEQGRLFAREIEELKKERAEIAKEKSSLEIKLREAVAKFGSESDTANAIRDTLRGVEDAWEDTTLAILQTEKAIRDMRAEHADEAIDGLKDYYGKMKDLALEAKDAEKKTLEESHKNKMDLYDKEIAKINDVYDASINKLDKEVEAETYKDELGNKNADKIDLMNKIALLSTDDSLEGRKRLADLQQELKDKQKEIDDFMKDNQLKALKEQLAIEKENQIAIIELEKEKDTAIFDGLIVRLDDEKTAITLHYDNIINDETRWAKVRDDAMKGNFASLETELALMQTSMTDKNSAIFASLAKDYATYMASIKQETKDIVSGVGDTKTDTSYEDANHAPAPAKQGRLKTGTFAKKSTADEINKIMKDGHASSSSKVVADGKMWRVISDFESVAKAQKVLDYEKKKGRLANGYVSSFETGGYTGEWGKTPKVALLHEKEIVLKKDDTRKLLDTFKLLDKVSSIMPVISRNVLANDLATGAMNITNNYGLTVNIDRLNGDKQGANIVVREIMKGLKKMGG